jgi:protein-S-isoprenylcysteine O-methyltransferase Ste14
MIPFAELLVLALCLFALIFLVAPVVGIARARRRQQKGQRAVAPVLLSALALVFFIAVSLKSAPRNVVFLFGSVLNLAWFATALLANQRATQPSSSG